MSPIISQVLESDWRRIPLEAPALDIAQVSPRQALWGTPAVTVALQSDSGDYQASVQAILMALGPSVSADATHWEVMQTLLQAASEPAKDVVQNEGYVPFDRF